MVQTRENPFTNVGRIVSGTRFIGRQEGLSKIEKSVFVTHPSNLAIIGEPRIGKSSLVYQAFTLHKQALNEKKILPIWINVGTFTTANELFVALFNQSIEELKKQHISQSSALKRAIRQFRQAYKSGYVEFMQLKYFFEEIKELGVQIIFIFDEFDKTRSLFPDDTSFQRLRTLSYEPTCRVAYITISRRSIKQIELQISGSSTLDGIFPFKYYLGPFKQADINQYWQRLSRTGLKVLPPLQQELLSYTGGHPFLLDMLSYELVECFYAQQKIAIPDIYAKVSTSFTGYYEHIEKLLQEEGRLNKLLQILFGPVIDVKPNDIKLFIDYGLLQEDTSGVYKAFSPHFQAHLQLIARSVDLWPIISQTEKALRALIEKKFQQVHGQQWISKLERKYGRLAETFEECRRQQRKDMTEFGRNSHNLLDYTYFRQLFDIISLEWDTCRFATIINTNKPDWELRAREINKVRNPLAHNRGEAIIAPFKHMQVEGYCQELLTHIHAFLQDA